MKSLTEIAKSTNQVEVTTSEPEVLVEVSNVSKKFARRLMTSLKYGAIDILREVLGLPLKETLRKNEFWAVKDVSFTLRRGECLGLIGHNGAGKSTLLKMLNGLIKPDTGSIKMRGRVAALIELGAGFNPILTGRENIYVNGQILGFTRQEIDEKLQDIVDFAEIGDFIDTPVQNYSSGMKVRLGFAVAAQMEPDVLIIDEVLAVGDLGFTLKCFNRIDTLLETSGVIFVSHSMPMISRMCSNLILLDKGRVNFYGSDVGQGIDVYYEKFGTRIKSFERKSGEVVLKFIGLKNKSGQSITAVNHGDDLYIEFRIQILRKYVDAFIGFNVSDKEQRPVGVLFNNKSVPSNYIKNIDASYSEIKGVVKSPKINLSKGIYSLTFFVSETPTSKPLVRLQSVLVFQVVSKRDVWPPIEFESHWV